MPRRPETMIWYRGVPMVTTRSPQRARLARSRAAPLTLGVITDKAELSPVNPYPPEEVKGHTQFPLEGVSFEATLNDAGATTDKQTQFYSMGGTRATWHQGWKAVAISPAAPDAWANFATQRWELFNTERVSRPGRQGAGEAAGAHPAVVGAGGPVQRPAAGEPQRRRDPHHGPAAADQAAEPVRVLPRYRRGARIGRAQHQEPLVHGGRRGDDRHRGRPGGAVRPRLPVRRPRPVCQGRQAQVRLQLRRRSGAGHRIDQTTSVRP